MSKPGDNHSVNFVFDPFRLDVTNACLWRQDEMITLAPKPFAVLTYLVRHAGQLVLKETLLDVVWPETAVSDAVLKTCMRQIRKALSDSALAPQYVATVHRRGYRFIAAVTTAGSQPSELVADGSDAERLDTADVFVEREAVLSELSDKLGQARRGRRQVVFVSGEAGMGKTSVVEAFAAQAAAGHQLQWASGQCVEHYGAGEAYLPVLEALSRLCRAPEGGRTVSLMRQHAPTWLVQMPWLLDPSDRELMQHELLGVTRERMLRELAEALEALAAEMPVVLVIEDLHWSDYATLDSIAMLARRQEPARLLLLGTYRPLETAVSEHPLRTVVQDLRLHGLGAEYALTPLSEHAVTAYLAARFPWHGFPASLAQVLHRRTDGNPLFLTTMTSSLLSEQVIGQRDGNWSLQTAIEEVESHVPEGLRSLIEQQLERLAPREQQLLEAASALGVEFPAAAVAAAVTEDLKQVEAQCEHWARQQRFLLPAGLDTWPDGTLAARYRFTHNLYQHVAYQRLGAGQRVQVHRRLLARLEAAYGERAHEIAAELARHAIHGHEIGQAVHYLLQASENAVRRYALHDAHEPLTKGLELLGALPLAPERNEQELAYLMVLRVVVGATKGYRSPEMEALLARISELYSQAEDLAPFAMGFWMGIWTWHLQRSDTMRSAQEVAERYLKIAQRQQDQRHILRASQALGTTLMFRGAPARAWEHLERARELYDPAQHNPAVMQNTQDPGVTNLCFMAVLLRLLGYPDQALQRCQEALALAGQLSHPYSLAFALGHASRLHFYRGEYHRMQAQAEALITLATQQDFRLLIRQGSGLQGLARVCRGEADAGIAQMHQSLVMDRPAPPWTFRARTLAELAEAYHRAGHIDAGLDAIDEALAIVRLADGHYYEAELHRLYGECLLQQTPVDTEPAEQCFHRALEVARRQEMQAWELRAAVSLGRLWRDQNRGEAARDLLAPVYNGFTEGFDTLDLQDAKSLLDQLSS